MQGFGETQYRGLCLVGVRERRWDSFPDETGKIVDGGERLFLVVASSVHDLAELGEIAVDRGQYDRLTGAGFGTFLDVTGTMRKGDKGQDKGRKIIHPSSIDIATSPAAESAA